MRRNMSLALACAAGLSLAFPPLHLGFLAYWSLIPLLLLVEDKSPAEAFRWGYITGFFLSAGTLYWIFWPTIPGAIATLLIHPLYYGVFALAVTFTRRVWSQGYLMVVPFFWTAIEYLKSLGELGFPWVTLGYSQTYYLNIIQFASVTSVYGVSFWIVCLNVIFLLMWQHREDSRWVIGCAAALSVLFVAPYLYGRAIIPAPVKMEEPAGQEVMQPNSGNEIRVAIVQGNIDPYQKWEKAFVDQNFEIYERLSRQSIMTQPELIIWPETATPTWLLHDINRLDRVRGLVNELRIPLLTGTPDYTFISANKYKTYNSAILISPGREEIPRYAKMHLVPLGERVPYEDEFPWLQKWIAKLEMGEGNFSPGESIELFAVPRNPRPLTNGEVPIHVATLICFESFFPEQARDFIARGADLLVVITNDGWFGPTGAPYWHAQMSVFRAIENRISVARCANTGVSMTIDPYGRVRSQSRIFEEIVLTDTLPLRMETTVYSTYGPIFANSIVWVSLLGIVFAAADHHKARRAAKSIRRS